MLELAYHRKAWVLTHAGTTVVRSRDGASVLERGRTLVKHGCVPGPGLEMAMSLADQGKKVNPHSFHPVGIKALSHPYIRSIE